MCIHVFSKTWKKGKGATGTLKNKMLFNVYMYMFLSENDRLL